MANQLSPELIAQLFAQESNDPFLTLITIENEADPGNNIYLVNNQENIISRGITFQCFPVTISLPVDDGESARQVSIDFDNVSLSLIGKFRSVTKGITVKVEMVLASLPDIVQISIENLVVANISYNKMRISVKLVLDNLLNTELSSERYTPDKFPGLF